MAAAPTIRTVGSDRMASWILDAQVAFESTSTTILNHSDQIRREYNSLRDECNKMTRHRVRLSEALVYNDTELDEMRLRTIRNVTAQISFLEDQCSNLMECLAEWSRRGVAIHAFDRNLEESEEQHGEGQ